MLAMRPAGPSPNKAAKSLIDLEILVYEAAYPHEDTFPLLQFLENNSIQ